MKRDDGYPLDLDSLPPGWGWGFVGDFAHVRSGYASGRHNANAVGIPHLRPMNVDRLGRLDLNELKYVDPQVSPERLAPGDVLFNNTNSPVLIGKTAFVGSATGMGFSNHMTRLRPKPGMEPRFLAFQLHWLWTLGYFRRRCTNHVNQASLAASVLSSSVPIAVAPFAHQQRLADFIDEQFSHLDAAQASIASALRRLRLLVERAYESVLGREWPCVSLSSLATTSSGGTPSRGVTSNFGGSISWVKSGELGDGLVAKTSEGITERGLASSNAKRLRRGTLLMAMYGATIGKLGILDIEGAATNQAVCAIEPRDPDIIPYLWIVLRAMRRQLIAAGFGGAQPNISQAVIRNLQIPVLPRDERARIVSKTTEIAAGCESLARAVLVVERRSRSINAAILTAAFSGQLHSDTSWDFEQVSTATDDAGSPAIDGLAS